MRFQFPPDDPADAGPGYRSRLFERFGDLLPVVTYAVLLWCIAVYFLLNKDTSGATNLNELAHRLGAMSGQDLIDGRWWTMIGSAFVHFNLWHIGFNMLWLVRLGSLMERGLGSIKTAAFIVAAAFVSSTFQIFIGGPGIGFSGVVYAMGGFIWGAWPRYTGFLESFNGSTLRMFIIWQGLCFIPTWGGLMPIGNTAHISGMIFGFLVGLWACKGTKRGWYWLTGAVLMVLVCVALLINVYVQLAEYRG